MASNQERNSCSAHTPHGYSKSQICFFKILRVISSIPPSKQEPHLGRGDDPSGSFPSRGFGVDLNLRLCSVAENAEFECLSENESDSSAIEENKGGEKSVDVSEITNTQVRSFKVDDYGVINQETTIEEQIGVEKEGDRDGEDREGKDESDGGDVETVPFEGRRQGSNNFLDLLIEAAKLVSGSESSCGKDESESNPEEPSGERGQSTELRTGGRNEGTGILEVKDAMNKGKQGWMVVDLCNEMDDTSPVVRSKRGRSQALPFRFRDSVVEPLKRSGRPPRPSTTGASRKRLIGS